MQNYSKRNSCSGFKDSKLPKFVDTLEDNLPALIWSIFPDGEADDFSRSWTFFSGFDLERLGGTGWLRAVHPADRTKLLRLNSKNFSTAIGSVDARIRGADGAFRWFLINRDGPLNAEGGEKSRQLVAVPMHERKLAELARDGDLARISTTLQHVPTMIWRTGASGEMDYANDRYLEAWDRTFEEVEGWGWGDAVHPEDRQGILDYWASHLESDDDGIYEFRAGSPEAGYRWFLSTSTALRDECGEIVNWYGATFDIEDRKQMEERLRRSEAFLRKAQLLSKTGSVGVNLLTGDHYWSDETYRIFEIDRSVKLGFATLIERVHPEDREIMADVTKRFRQAETGVDAQLRLLMPDGRLKHVRILASNDEEAGDENVYIGAIMDITAAKLAEESAQQAGAELARVMRIATMAELAGSIAHEVNQPLAAILAYGKASLRWMNRPVPEMGEAKAAIEQAVAGAERARDVVARLRQVFTRKDPEPSILDLNELVERTLPLLQPQVGRHQADVRLDLANGLPAVTADPVQIQQVIINFVTNGLQAPRPENAVACALQIRTELDDASRVVLSVTDNGRGIPNDSINRLFEPFFTTKNEGMGMGLSICRTIIQSHSGHISARNEPNGGATVSFMLPMAAS